MAAGVFNLTRPHGPGMSDAGRVIACATAIASICAGVIHISAAADHENLPVMMAGFLIVATLQVGLGGLLIWRRPNALLIGAALAMMLASLGLWLLSRTSGLPFLEGGHMEPIGFKDGVTVLFEIASVPGLLLLLSRELSGFTLPARLGAQTVGMLGAAAFVLLMPAFIADGGAHHSHDEAVAMGIHDDGHAHSAGEEHADADAAAHADEGGHADGGDDHAESGHHAAGGGGHAKDGHTDHAAGGEELASLMSGSGGHGHGTGGHHEPASHDAPTSGGGTDGHAHGDEDGGGGEQQAGDHGHDDNDSEQQGGDHGHGDGGTEHGGDDHSTGNDGGEQDSGGQQGAVSAGYTPAEPAPEDGRPRGSQIYVRMGEEKEQAADHHQSSEPCNPTPEQRAAADALVSQTREALKKYDNNPARALADGYEIAFRGAGTPDRFVHMFSAQHTYDTPGVLPQPSAVEQEGEPVILDPDRIESFMYAMTDQGLTAIGGMYMMPAEYDEAKGDFLRPRAPFEGPQMGGCLTRWHDHPELGRMTNRSGAPTPQMLHVWTYPGLEPFSEYDGREMSQLWKVGSLIPDISVPVRPATISELLLKPDQ